MMMPRKDDIADDRPALLEEAGFPEKLPEDAPVSLPDGRNTALSRGIIGILGFTFLGIFHQNGFNITINTVNTGFSC